MKRALLLSVMILSGTASSAYAYKCGPFDIWESNTYCVSCASRTFKAEFCPGGETGRVAAGVSFPGCSISYDSPSCMAVGFTNKNDAETFLKGLEKAGK